jgi:hypothetical protein
MKNEDLFALKEKQTFPIISPKLEEKNDSIPSSQNASPFEETTKKKR